MRTFVFHLKRSGGHLIKAWMGQPQQPSGRRRRYMFGFSDAQTPGSRLMFERQLERFGREGVSDGVIGVEDLPYTWVSDLLPEGDRAIIVLRDPINVLASCLEVSRSAGRSPPVGETRSGRGVFNGPRANGDFISPRRTVKLFGQESVAGDGVTTIIYDRFISDADYRRELADKLGAEVDESALDAQAPGGAGSSFRRGRSPEDGGGLNRGGHKHQPLSEEDRRARLDRWRSYVDDEEFLWYLRYPGFLAEREKVFGPLPEELSAAL